MIIIFDLATLLLIYALMAQALNLTLGLGRLFNLAHVAIGSIGAYVVALGSTRQSLEWWTLLPLAMVASGAASLILACIAARLKNDYFAIGSLAFATLIVSVQMNWRTVTNGTLGVPGIPRPRIVGLELIDTMGFAAFTLIIAAAAFFFLQILWTSPFSRSLRAIADFEDSAAGLGMNAVYARTRAFVVASAISGLAGGLHVYFVGFLDPSTFALPYMVLILTMVVAGRPGSFWGVIISVGIFTILPELLRHVEIPSAVLGPTRQLIYATLLLACAYLFKSSVFVGDRQT